ncbi:MAG: hypothetical protein KDK08_29940 [Rhizobiaceae bacterium]|nr:hypothetical protein [Rhizobiaceae bacterium]
MGIEPSDKDLPSGVHQCSDVVPANGQPFYDGSNTNPNCPEIVPADGQSNVSNCHADPYDNSCSHSERLLGSNKYGMTANYGSFQSNMWIAFILAAALIFVVIGVFLLPSIVGGQAGQSGQLLITVNRNLGSPSSSSAAAAGEGDVVKASAPAARYSMSAQKVSRRRV